MLVPPGKHSPAFKGIPGSRDYQYRFERQSFQIRARKPTKHHNIQSRKIHIIRAKDILKRRENFHMVIPPCSLPKACGDKL
jgi:hypothetical protein